MQCPKLLVHIAPTEKGTVLHFTDSTLGARLISMGILPGSTIEVVRKAPFGGALYVKIEEQRYALRRAEASHIVIA